MSEAQAAVTPQAPTESAPASQETAPQAPVTPATQADAAKPAAAAPEAQPQVSPEVKPEAFDLKLSEGSLLKPETVKAVEEFARANNLSAKAAKEVLAREELSAKAFHEQAQSQAKQQVEAWKKQSLHDAEFGGEKLQASSEIAKRAMTKYGGEQMAKILDETGYGNHPEVIRMFYRIGQAMSEGRMIPGGGSTGSTIPIEQKFYKNSK